MLIKRFGTAVGLVLLSAQLAHANFQKGQDAFDRNDVTTAIDEWRADARTGDAKAQYALGQIFEKGAGDVKADLVEAYAWFKLAAAQNVAGANEAIERLRKEMTPEELGTAQEKAIAALGVWYRQYAGQDEAAFQEQKAANKEQAAEQKDPQQAAAQARLATQKALIAERKAKAEAEAKLIEESRKAAILAAQRQAEEAKQAAFEREQKIAEEKRLAALQNDKGMPKDLNAVRARLEALKAKQSGVKRSDPVVVARVPAPEVAESKLAAPAPQPAAVKTTSKIASLEPEPVSDAKVAELEAKVSPAAGGKSEPVALQQVTPEKPGGAAVEMQKPELTQKKIALAPIKEPEAGIIPEKIDMAGLDRQAVKQIFEAAKTADLSSPAAKSEIADSFVRIDALKWSLISGAKGDTAAPKMNKVLMSKMTPVQIAEANRLAGEWLLERQSRL